MFESLISGLKKVLDVAGLSPSTSEVSNHQLNVSHTTSSPSTTPIAITSTRTRQQRSYAAATVATAAVVESSFTTSSGISPSAQPVASRSSAEFVPSINVENKPTGASSLPLPSPPQMSLSSHTGGMIRVRNPGPEGVASVSIRRPMEANTGTSATVNQSRMTVNFYYLFLI